MVDSKICVSQGLRFDSLRSIDDQQSALARSQRPRDFVAEVHMAGRVDEIQLIKLPIFGGVHHADRVRFDGDAALAFEVHGVKHLSLHFARRQRACELKQTVGERGFAVIDVRDDREIADVLVVHDEAGRSQ